MIKNMSLSMFHALGGKKYRNLIRVEKEYSDEASK